MDIKEKLRLRFKLNRQGSSTTSNVATPIESPMSPPRDISGTFEQEDQKGIETKSEVDMMSIEDVLPTIEDVYYNDETFDAKEHILKKLPDVLNVDEIVADRKKLARQLRVVTERVSVLILEKESAYMKELETVHQLQNGLQEALTICYEARRGLSYAQHQFTVASLGILSNYYKRQQLLGILQSLRMIKTLQQTDVRLRELLEEEDYPGAINLCLACQKAVLTFRKYRCISELSTKLQDTIETIEEQLDVALSRVCSHFDTGHYEKVQLGYRLLGKTQIAMDQLHMHFTTAIHNTAFTIVLGYVELCSVKAGTSFHKRQYQDLCKFVTTESFTACLVDLCKAMWQIMHSYYRVMEWHQLKDGEKGEENHEKEEGLGLEANFNRRYIRQKLEHGLIRIWQDVQQKVKSYLLASDLSNFKYDEFIHVLDLVNRLIEVGEEFCGSKSDGLQESVRRQSVNYFRNYHRTSMEELRMFLENEGWELCPVKLNFTVFQLVEFRFLNHSKEDVRKCSVGSAAASSPNHKSEGSESFHESKEFRFFRKYYEEGNPFGIRNDDDNLDDEVSSILIGENDRNETYEDSDSNDSDVPEELKQDYVDERTGEIPSTKHSKTIRNLSLKSTKGQPPILTNTTLGVLRLFGKYMQMMNVLKPIAFDVLICMSQLFEYYMFAVYSFFATDLGEVGDAIVSDKLRSALRRIDEKLIYDETTTSPQNTVPGNGGDNTQKDKVPKPNLSPIVNLHDRDSLFGLAERMVAAESLVFLAEQFKLLHSHLDALIPAPKRTSLHQFYSCTVSMGAEQRRPVYVVVAAKAIDYEQTLALMANVKWDVGDIMSQHSPYVDILLREMQVFSMRLSEVSKRVPVSHEAYNILWTHCIRLTNKTFVEGFASARKCSNEGRALMQLDFQQFLIKLEKITDLRPIPDKDYVESYVKAFYLPENILEEWIIGHKEYSTKQITSLVGCMTHINKKARQKLFSIIEEIEKSKK